MTWREFTLMAAACVSLLSASAHGQSSIENEYLITASYYPWYYPERWNYTECVAGLLRTNLVPAQQPVLGAYSSADSAVINRHIEWCSENGINVLMIEYIRPGDFIDTVLTKHFLKSPRINDIYFTFLYDWAIVFPNFTVDDAKITQAVSHFNYIADTYFAHPRYLKIKNGRPVIFIYVTRALTPANMVQKLASALRAAMQAKGYDIYLVGDEYFFLSTPQSSKLQYWDAIFGYDVYASKGGYPDSTGYLSIISSSQSAYKQTASATTVLGKTTKVAFIPSCMPGFNDRAIRRTCANHPALARRKNKNAAEGSMFQTAFGDISFAHLDTAVNMISITSFNEWHEDTQLEPTFVSSATFFDNSTTGTQYTQGILHEGYGMKYLDIIRNKVVAVAGNVRFTGASATGAAVSAYDSATNLLTYQKPVFSTGKFTLSRKMLYAGITFKLTASAPGYMSQSKYCRVNADSTVTGLDFLLQPSTQAEHEIPPALSFAVAQNYPNPFNQSTTITYTMPQEGRVTMKIFDILGNEIRMLINEERQAGRYVVNFNAAMLPSSLYFYELRVNEYRAIRKMILLK
jgi:hypothetical protein